MHRVFEIKRKDRGFAAFFVTILILAVVFGIGTSIFIMTYGEQKIIKDIVKSSQAYYTAEAGMEDALLKLVNKWSWSSPYQLTVGDNWATTTITNAIGGSRTIISEGYALGRIRKVRTNYELSLQGVSFYYGAQVGEGGMEMGNGSVVQGNIFSNGSVVGGGEVTDNIIVAGDVSSGNKIDGLTVGGDAIVPHCEDSNITGDLTYVSGGTLIACSVGGSTVSQPGEIEPVDLPISQEYINSWKADAATGGIINSDVVYSGISSLGSIQIGTPSAPKNMTLSNNAILTIQGTVYVTGDIILINGAILRLDPNIYGSLSGVIISDGKIDISNNVMLQGSGQPGSYLLLVSTDNSLDPAAPAIFVKNNAMGAIFYASNGLIYLNNNMTAREVTGYKVRLANNAEVQYESGLESALFSSGTGGSWQISNWGEVE